MRTVKAQIQGITGIPRNSFRLCFRGQVLESYDRFHTFDIQKEYTLDLVIRGRGGAKGKPLKMRVAMT
jgi:hypothetical protein